MSDPTATMTGEVTTVRHLQRHHTDTTRAQLAAWDRAVKAWRRAGLDERNADGSDKPYVGEPLDAAVAWLIVSGEGVIGTPAGVSYVWR